MMIGEAIKFARYKHRGQLRRYTDEPYVSHVLEVAATVAARGARSEVITAAILHDTLEDTATSYEEIEKKFGRQVAGLVLELTDVYIDTQAHGDRRTRKELEKNRLAMVSADAQTIKVADLIDNTRTIAALDPKFAVTYLAEKRALLEVLTAADPLLRAMAWDQLGGRA